MNLKNIPEKQLFNRDLSWLAFNERVLDEAADTSVPVLERLRFLGIVSSNLNEFFMVRVAEIARLARRFPGKRFPDGLTTSQAIVQIRKNVLRQKSRQAQVFKDILSDLKKSGIRIYVNFDQKDEQLNDEIRKKISAPEIFLFKPGEAIPELKSDRIHIFVKFSGEYAVISLKKREDRLLRLNSPDNSVIFVLTDRWICSNINEFFPGKEIIESFPFKIIREYDFRYRFDEDESVEEYIEYKERFKGRSRVIRLEVDASNYSEGAMYLASALRLDSSSLYRFDMPLDIRSFLIIYSLKGFEKLKYPAIIPVVPPIFEQDGHIMDAISVRDIILHHPYDSFDIVVNFLKEAVSDPEVSEIFHVVYRAGNKSPIIDSLKEAAGRGKKVTVYVEVKARFDEINNLRWIKELRAANVRVIPPFSGYKVHSKVTQVVKISGGHSIFYTHLGTGNYHTGTAKQYTDLGLLTCNEEIGREVNGYFNALATRQRLPYFRNLLVAPANLRNGFLRLIREEIKHHKLRGDGLIIAKMNSLVDPDIINTLYEASRAGVRVKLLVRGICCLKPGIKNLSENIKVISIVDRFLEHSRIYYFHSGGTEKIYLASADWMPRNFYTRFEIAFPIYDPFIKKYIKETILEKGLSDNVKSSMLMPNGKYSRIVPEKNEKRIRSQFLFVSLAQKYYKGTPLEWRFKKKK